MRDPLRETTSDRDMIADHPFDTQSESKVASNGLVTECSLEDFESHGWVGPYPLLTQQEAGSLCQVYDSVIDHFARPAEMRDCQERDAFTKRPWFKSMHAHVPAFYDLANHPAIVKKVTSILGPDVIAWGMTVTVLKPGAGHRWHVDVEHRYWPGISVFIGLKHLSRSSTLKVINGSHKLTLVPQEAGVISDEDALRTARQAGEIGGLETIDLADGDFFMFAGNLWHGSENTSNNTRLAILVQYSHPSAYVKIPLNWDEPIQWHCSKPPCVLVAGSDHAHTNLLVSRPD